MEFSPNDTRVWSLELATQLYYLQGLCKSSEPKNLLRRLSKIKHFLSLQATKFTTAQTHLLERTLQPDTTDAPAPPALGPSIAGLLSTPSTLSLSSASVCPRLPESVLAHAHKLLLRLGVNCLNLKDAAARKAVRAHKHSLLHVFCLNGWTSGLQGNSVLLDSCYALHKVAAQLFVLSGTRILDGLYRSVCAVVSKDGRSFDESVLYDDAEVQHIVHFREKPGEDLYSFGFQYEQPAVSVFRNQTHLADVTTKHASSYGPEGIKPAYARGAVMLGYFLVYVSEKQTLNVIDIRNCLGMEANKGEAVPILELTMEHLAVEKVQDIRLDKEAVCPTAWALTKSGEVYSVSFDNDPQAIGSKDMYQLNLKQLNVDSSIETGGTSEFHTTISVKDHHLVYCSMQQQKKQVLVHRVNKHTGKGHSRVTLELTMNPVHQILLLSLEGILGSNLFHLVVLVGEMKSITLLLLHQSGELTFWNKQVLPSTNTYLYVVQDMGLHPVLDDKGQPTDQQEHSVLLAGVSKTKIIFSVRLIL